MHFLQSPILYLYLMDYRWSFVGISESRDFTQYFKRLSPLIPTKTLVPNKTLMRFGQIWSIYRCLCTRFSV
jgi:hypothetical protein